MMVGVQGSDSFNDYAIFLSGIGRALRRLDAEDKTFTIFSAGGKRVKEMSLEFINVSNFKARGISAKVVMVPEGWIRSNYEKLDMFSYFCNEREPFSKLVKFLEDKEVDVQVFRYHATK